MKDKIKNALVFGGFIILTSLAASFLSGEPFFTTTDLLSILIVAIVAGYIFGFLLKGSFGWKHKNDDI